jgi:PBP1b-binding outer membrane lipoprotein LpoB
MKSKILLIILIAIMLGGCIKDYDFNPWTTVLQQTVKGSTPK